MPLYTDQTGHALHLNQTPKRIISLVPSQTELLYDLGLRDEVIGITKFCIHPDNWFRSKQRVGGTKSLYMDVIRNLEPDLIIANKEENVKEQVEELVTQYPVWTSDINTLQQAFEMITEIAKMIDKESAAKELLSGMKNNFEQLRTTISTPHRAVYLIWQRPYMTIGGDTFIHAMMKLAGFENIYGDQLRYPEITLEEIINQKPSCLLLSSEPYPFKQKHIEELRSHLPGTKIVLVDGEMFSWYGSRMLKATSYFQNLKEMIDNG